MKYLLIYCFTFFLLISCDRSDFVAEPYDPNLPIVSSQGKNTSGFYYNGGPVNDASRSFFNYYVEEDTLFLTIGGINSVRLKIVDDFNNNKQRVTIVKGNTYQFENTDNNGLYLSNSIEANKGKVTFFNPVGGIIAGTFYFEFTDEEGNLNKVTAGRFDYDLD